MNARVLFVKALRADSYARLLTRRNGGAPSAMAAEDAKFGDLVDLQSSLIRVDEPTPAQAAAGRYPKRAIPWQGLTIRIENETGSVRRGTKPDGSPWETRMAYPYGEIARTEGVDGDPVDVFIGPFPDVCDTVFVIHQRRVDDWSKYDEDKCMIGWLTEAEAVAAFLQCYDDPQFLGPITAMPVAEFVAKVRATRHAPKMIKAVQMITRKDGIAQRYHVADPEPEQPAEQSLADDMEAQMKWLDAQAVEMDYSGIEDLAARNYPAFEQLAAKWREDHPVEVALKAIGADRRRVLFLKAKHRGDTVTEPRAELIAEHERLVDVLESPSHEDDEAEAKRQAKELAEYKAGSNAPLVKSIRQIT